MSDYVPFPEDENITPKPKSVPMDEQRATALLILNEALLGAPDLLAKTLTGQENYEKIKKEREALPESTKLGATAASMIIPTGGILKGAGALAKGLGSVGKTAEAVKLAENANKLNTLQKVGSQLEKAGKFVSGAPTGVGNAFLRGAGAGLEQAIPRLGFKAGAEGELDPMKFLTEAGTSAGLGGLAGGVFKGAGDFLKNNKGFAGKFVGDMEKEARKATLSNMGADMRGMKALTKKGMVGSDAAKLDKLGPALENMERFGKEHNLMMPVGRDDVLSDIYYNLRDKYKEIENVFQKEKPDIKKFMDDPTNRAGSTWEEAYETLKSTYPRQAEQAIDDIQKAMSIRTDLNGKRKYLKKLIEDSYKGSGDMAAARGEAAKALWGALDDSVDHVLQKNGLDSLYKVNQDYKALQFFASPQLRSELKLPESSLGSKTFISNEINNMIKSGNVNPMSFVTELLGKATQATLGTGAKYAVGASLGPLKALREKLESGQGINLPTPVQKVADFVGSRPGGIGNVIEKNMAKGSKVEDTPEEKEKKKEVKYSEAYFNRLVPGMKELYIKTGARDQGATWDEFVDYIEKKTEGFKPREVAGLLYKDKTERKKFLRDLDRAEKFKQIDLNKALSQDFLEDIPVIGSKNQAKEELVNFLASITASNADLGDEKATKNIDEFVKKVRGMDPKRRKKALLDALQNKDIIDLATINEWGLV